MITPTSLFVSLLLASPILASHVDSLPARHSKYTKRFGRFGRRAADPATLSKGSLSSSEGCTQFHNVEAGEYCYKVAEKFDLTLEEFFTLNPQVDSDCTNLWASYDYCVSTSGSTSSSATVPAATPTPTPTPTATADEEEEVCDSDDVEEPTKAPTAPHSEATLAKAATRVKAAKVSQNAAADAAKAANKAAADAAAAAQSSKAAAAAESSKAAAAAAAAASSKAAAAAQATPPPASSGGGVGMSLLNAVGITGFLGKNSGIGSWFRTNYGGDSTNGNSWCGYPYNDQTPGFAPSVGTMLRNFGGDYEKAATAYCGLEATFTAPDGRKTTLVIADGFDDKWVLSPGSTDIVIGHFASLFGRTTDNKNDVVRDLAWEFTGRRVDRYKFKGQGAREW